MKKYILLTITAMLVASVATAQTLTITTSSGSKQYSAADVTFGSPATFSDNGTKMTIGSNAYHVSDIISALVAMENAGHVKATCSNCDGSTQCPTCHGSGKGCTTCNGTGEYCSSCGTTGKDQYCEGTGRCKYCYYGECYNCDGSGNNRCSYCFGNRDCPGCGGAGTYKGLTCTTCKGSRKCPKCNGSGTTGRCNSCGGTGRCSSCGGSNDCSKCKGTGTCTVCYGQPKCYTCGGDGHCAACINSDGKCSTCSGKGYVWVDIKLSDTSLDISYLGESRAVSVSINQSWKATCSASWITLKDAEGRNSGTLTITADANPSEDSRTATVVISYGGKSERISITQRGVPVNLSVSTTMFNVHRKGGEQTLSIISDTDWEISTDASWLSLSKSNGYGNDVVVVTAAENPGDARYAFIKLKHNKTEVNIVVTQDAKLYVPFEISNVIVMNTSGESSSSIINMEKDGFYASTLVYLSERITFGIKTYGTYTMTRKWYSPGSSQPDRVDTYALPFSSIYENPFTVSIYNTIWRPSSYTTGTYRWEYYYEDELIYTKYFIVH